MFRFVFYIGGEALTSTVHYSLSSIVGALIRCYEGIGGEFNAEIQYHDETQDFPWVCIEICPSGSYDEIVIQFTKRTYP